MTKEIGGYFELETFTGEEYHAKAYAFDSGRNALAALVQARGYRKIYLPDYCCDSVADGVKKGGADYTVYPVDKRFRPKFNHVLHENEAILIVNYYGQLTNEELLRYAKKFSHIIVDNTQAFFQRPLAHIDTTYSCRKFFGVADGGYLYTDIDLDLCDYSVDVSAERMLFVLGRYDVSGSAYYRRASENNEIFTSKPIKRMSKLTHNLLRAVDYESAALKRRENAEYLHKNLASLNEIEVQVPYGAFMYPFLTSLSSGGAHLRKTLQQSKIYVPCLWPDTLKHTDEISVAYQMAKNVVPLPCDQRYTIEDMDYILEKIFETVEKG